MKNQRKLIKPKLPLVFSVSIPSALAYIAGLADGITGSVALDSNGQVSTPFTVKRFSNLEVLAAKLSQRINKQYAEVVAEANALIIDYDKNAARQSDDKIEKAILEMNERALKEQLINISESLKLAETTTNQIISKQEAAYRKDIRSYFQGLHLTMNRLQLDKLMPPPAKTVHISGANEISSRMQKTYK